MAATRYDMRIEQGKTLQRIVRWETLPLIYIPITAIAQTAPVRITAPNHGMPDGWRTAVINVKGMHEINAKRVPPRGSDFHRTSVYGPDDVTWNDVSAADYDAYTSGGYLTFYTPMPLSGYSARMQIKDYVGGTVLQALHSPTEITIDPTGCTILLQIDADTAAAWTWDTGVYDLEMVSPTNVVTAILTGSVTLTPEVTTSA